MAKDLSRINSDEEIEKRDVDLSGFEYVTKGYFPHTFDPAINIRPDRIYFNAAIIKKLPDVFYIQLLINPKEKTLIIKPCNEDDKDAIKWACVEKKTGRKQNRDIKATLFCAKLYEIMGWRADFRYKICANIVESRGQYIFVVNLTEAEATSLNFVDGRKVYLPEKWRDSFGTPYSEHDQYLSVQLLDGYARVQITNSRKGYIKPKPKNHEQLNLLEGNGDNNGDSQ